MNVCVLLAAKKFHSMQLLLLKKIYTIPEGFEREEQKKFFVSNKVKKGYKEFFSLI